MPTLTRDQILARKTCGAEPYDLSDGSGTVMIRGLTRNEALAVQRVEDLGDKDNLMISCALVDPALTPADVGAWGDTDPAGVLVDLSNRISELSGMSEGAGKSRVPGSRRRR